MTYSIFGYESIPPLKEVSFKSQILSGQKDGGCLSKFIILRHPSQNHLNNDFDLPSKGDFLKPYVNYLL